MNRLQDKVAILTGAGTREVEDDALYGTGSATAILFAREGAKVVVVDMNSGNAERTRARIRDEGGEVEVVETDVSNPSQCRAAVEAAICHFGRVDILFNNVGTFGSGKITEVDEDIWDHQIAIGLKGMAFMCKYAIPRMAETGGGSIINISSIDGMRAGFRPNVPYGAAKGGIISMTRHTAVHHGRENIRVNCIAPGHIYTTFVSSLSEEDRDRRRRISPLGTEGTAWDVAWAAVYLASDEARWVSGVVLPVDAGLFAGSPLSLVDNLMDGKGSNEL